MTKKLLSVLLAFLIVCSLLPFAAFASGTDTFATTPEIEIPNSLKSAVTTNWDTTTNVLTATIGNGITDAQWAFLFSYFSWDGEISLHCDFDFPEGTVGFVCSDEGQEDSFEDFQTDAESHVGEEDYYWDLEGDRSVGRPIVLADYTVEGNEVTITPRNRENGYEYFAWVNDQNEIISCSKFDIEVVSNCEASYTYDIDDLEGLLPSEHRIRLEDDGFFDSWNEDELIQDFEDGDFKVEVLYPGDVDGENGIERTADFSESIECEFVNGIFEITLHKMTPELLEKTFDINSDTQGTFFIRLKITLPDGTEKMKRSQGNGRYAEAKEGLDDLSELDFNDQVTYCYVDAGRFVRDSGIVNYFPEEDSGLFGCFIGYTTDNTNVKQRALMTYVTAAEDSKPVSFANPHNITPVGVSQIEVDEDYWEKMAGRDYGEGNVYKEAEYSNPNYKPNYNSETGTLTYAYQGEKTDPEEIANDLNIQEDGDVETYTKIHAPEGYVLKGTYNKDGDLIQNGNGEDSETEVWCHFGEDGSIINVNSHWTFVWKLESKWNEEDSPENLLLQEMYITNDFGVQLTFYDIYWEAPAENRIEIYSEDLERVVTLDELKEKGITVIIDDHGYVRTAFDLNADIGYFGRCFAFIRPPEGAEWCKTSNGGGSTEMPRYSHRDADELKHTLEIYDFEPVQTGDDFYRMHSYPVCIPDKAIIETPDGNSITVWYTAFISVENFVVEWYKENEEGEPELIEGNFLYGSMDDLSYVQETTEIEEDELDENVVYPTIVQSNGESKNRKLWSKKNPQDSGSGSVMIELKELGEIDPNETKCIFIPLEYIDYDGEWGEGRVDFVVRHFEGCEGLTELEEAAKNGSGVKVDCEYNEFGLYIYTNTFSPFVITCNAVEPEKHRHSSDTVIIGARDTDEEKAEAEENPETGALVTEKPVELLAAGMILSFAIMSLSKNK